MIDKYIGNKYNELTIISTFMKNGKKRCTMLCNCGEQREAIVGNVVNGSIKSCKSCTAIRVSKQNSIKATKHGLSSSGLYQSWKCMKSRCKDTTHPYYSKLNITYCSSWESFEGFKNWAELNGWQEGLTIDRINSKLGYNPSNCQWLTRKENSARANTGRIPWNKS